MASVTLLSVAFSRQAARASGQAIPERDTFIIPQNAIPLDKRFRLGRAELVVFLDVLNVLNRPIAEEVLWDPTYTRQGYISGLPIVADLGLRGEW